MFGLFRRKAKPEETFAAALYERTAERARAPHLLFRRLFVDAGGEMKAGVQRLCGENQSHVFGSQKAIDVVLDN